MTTYKQAMSRLTTGQRRQLRDALNDGHECEHDVTLIRVTEDGEVHARYHGHVPTARDGWIYLGSVSEVVERYHLGDSLRLRRRAAGLTQAELAKRMGVAANTVACWERGEQTMSTMAIKLLAVVLAEAGKSHQ